MQSEALVPGVTDEEEMTRLIKSYGDMLLGMCTLFLKDRYLAQDIVQETFVRAWNNRAKQKGSEKAWLIRVATNLCHDYHRSRWFRHIEQRISVEELQFAVPMPENSEILDLVHQLPYKEKEAVILFFWNNLSADEIALATGTSRASVYRRLEKAKKHLKLELEGGWQNEGT